MSVLPQLERELLAAHGRFNRRRRFFAAATLSDRFGMRWLPRTIGAVPIALAVFVTVAVALIALTVRHGGSPSPQGAAPPPSAPPPPLLPAHPSRRQQQEMQYLDRAWAATMRRNRECAPDRRPFIKPTISQGAPDQALLSTLGVLRRPAQPTDLLPKRVTYHPYTVSPQGSLPPVKQIYVHYIRRARWRFGAGYYIVPAGNINPGREVPERCYTAQRSELQRELARAHVSQLVRAQTLTLEPRFLAWARYDSSPRPGVCLLALNSTGNGDVGCGEDTVTNIETGRTFESGGPTGVGVVYGLAPDGVATVTLYYHGRYPGHPITVHSISNVFIVPNPRQRFPDDGFPYKVVWRSTSGAVLKTITY